MAASLVERVSSKYRRDGLIGLLQLVGPIVLKEPFRQYLLARGTDDIVSRASSIVSIEDSSKSTITYGGLREPPHPSQIISVVGRGVATPREIYEFRDATVVGSRPLFLADGKYIAPSSIGTTDVCKSEWKLRKTFHFNVSYANLLRRSHSRAKFIRDVDTAFLLTGYFGDFGHWTFEILPKMYAYEEYAKLSGINPVILTGTNLNSWQKESLKLLGYPPDSLLQMGSEPLSVRQLLVPSHRFLTETHVPTYPSIHDLTWVRDRIKRNLPTVDRSFGERIFISREDAPKRHIRNRKAVRDVLEEYDFEVYEPGRLSFADQVRLFSGADLIVGPYGAGVSNIIFAENAKFVELVVDAEANIHHFVLANLLNIDYEYVSCRPHVERGVKIRNSDMEVDIAQLRDVIEAHV